MRSLGPRDAEAHDLLQAELPTVDAAIRASEAKWGPGRLETLITPDTLTRWKRGWSEWSEAVWSGNLTKVRELGPKIKAALAYMDAEATRAGHQPINPQTWEAMLPDGRVMILVRDLFDARAVAQQAAGRHAVVWTLAEIAEIVGGWEAANAVKREFPGATVQKLTMRSEGFASDYARDPEWLEAASE